MIIHRYTQCLKASFLRESVYVQILYFRDPLIYVAFKCSHVYLCKRSKCFWEMLLSSKKILFDTVILLESLENLVRLSGMVLKWFRSYLEGRGYFVSIGEHKSKWTSMTCGVSQGSILAPLLFSLYMLPLSQIIIINPIAS